MKALLMSAFLIYVLNLNELHLSSYTRTTSGNPQAMPAVQFVYSALLFLSLSNFLHKKIGTSETCSYVELMSGLARLRAVLWSALIATGNHSLPTLQVLQSLG
jgi:hypothetical protein